MLLFGGPGPARLIDHTSGEVNAARHDRHRGIVSPDGKYVVTQPEDPGPVRIVDLARPTEPGRAIAFDGSLSTAPSRRTAPRWPSATQPGTSSWSTWRR